MGVLGWTITLVAAGFGTLWALYGLDEVRRWLRVLWVCRVSTFSVLFGFALMFLPQAQDVFAETRAGWLYWAVFFLVVIVCWAFSVRYAARQVLEYEHWALDPSIVGADRESERLRLQAVYGRAINLVPSLLGLSCFWVLFTGLWSARTNLAAALNGLPEAANASNSMWWLLVTTAAAGILFFTLAIVRGSWIAARANLFGQANLKQSFFGTTGGISTGDLLWFKSWLSRSSLKARYGDAPAAVRNEGLFLLYLALLLAVLIVAGNNPFWLSEKASRGIFLVLLLGAWVVPLSYLAAWSHRLKIPLLFIVFVLLVTATELSSKFNDIRMVDNRHALSRDLRQVTMTEAIAQWKKANGCDAGQRPCPAPIIVAGQGGASRAAYFTATTVAHLIHETRTLPEIYEDGGKRIFALSTVSGSSLAAVVLRAALEDALLRGAVEHEIGPCRAGNSLWFGYLDGDHRPTSWRTCIQTILAGDFLSPTFVGLGLRDRLSIENPFSGRPAWGDRAMILERAWEERYRAIAQGRLAAGQPKNPGLARPLGYAKHTIWPKENGRAWLPLLFLNGTSLTSGRRVIATDVKPYYCDGKSAPQVVYAQAYDFFEIAASTRNVADAGLPKLTCPGERVDDDPLRSVGDLRLSTAATVSARFPIISPPGAVRNVDGVIADRIVDGGYFENDGLATARDIARILIADGLHPVVLLIQNDPERRRGEWPVPRPVQNNLALPATGGSAFLASLFSPFAGLNNSRAGHGSEAADQVVRLLGDQADPPAYLTVRVTPELPPSACLEQLIKSRPSAIALQEISMSWWLSQPVQRFLDAQLCDAKNQEALFQLRRHLRRDSTTRAGP